GLAGRPDGSRIGLHYHPGIHLPYAGGGISPRLYVHHAHATDRYRGFVLLVAKHRNWNSVSARRVKNCGARGHGDRLTINGKLHIARARPMMAHACPPCGKQTPAGQRWLTRCSSTSWRKYLSTLWIGAGTICPSPQMEVCFSAWESSSIIANSPDLKCPLVHSCKISTIFCDQMRQGTHFPHDSLR